MALQLALPLSPHTHPDAAVEARPNPKGQGFVETPPWVVEALTQWAIREPTTRVLDIGLGDGRFLVASARRLQSLGADRGALRHQLFGVEIDGQLFEHASARLAGIVGATAPGLFHGDLLDMPPRTVDAVVGNPPYVRRHHISRLDGWLRTFPRGASRLADLSVLFVCRATQQLAAGGRLAVIMSSGWLDQAYGEGFKAFLLAHYEEVRIVGFNHRVFAHALVRPVMLLARRRASRVVGSGKVTLIRSEGRDSTKAGELGLGPSQIGEIRSETFLGARNLSALLYRRSELALVDDLGLAELPLAQHARVRIGFQSFAKAFFLFTSERSRTSSLSARHLRPIILSPKHLRSRVVLHAPEVSTSVFWAEGREQLDASARRYVEEAESKPVPVRGKGRTVIGFQEVPRVKRANRHPWFNVVSELRRRGGRPILLPRRTFERYQAVSNPDLVPATEHFLEMEPLNAQDLILLLAYLNSSFGELSVRLASHQYGGGVFNLNPSQARQIPVPDLARLRSSLDLMAPAWRAAAALPVAEARPVLDGAIARAVGVSSESTAQVQAALVQLKASARSLNRGR